MTSDTPEVFGTAIGRLLGEHADDAMWRMRFTVAMNNEYERCRTSVVHVGQRLGTENKVTKLLYYKTWGWVARDSTGAEYAQRLPNGADRFRRIIVPRGLGGLPWPPALPTDSTARPEAQS